MEKDFSTGSLYSMMEYAGV